MRALKKGQPDTDLVFFDHSGIGVTGVFGVPHEGQCVVWAFSGICHRAQRLHPAEPRDEPVFAAFDFHHFDRGLLATAAQGGGEHLHFGLIKGDPVARQVVPRDILQRNLDRHTAFAAGSLHFRCDLFQGGHGTGLTGDIGNRRAAWGRDYSRGDITDRHGMSFLWHGKSLWIGCGQTFAFGHDNIPRLKTVSPKLET